MLEQSRRCKCNNCNLTHDDPRHGTSNGYTNLECRCQLCREAWAVAHWTYMHADPTRLERHRLRQQVYRDRKRKEGAK